MSKKICLERPSIVSPLPYPRDVASSVCWEISTVQGSAAQKAGPLLNWRPVCCNHPTFCMRIGLAGLGNT